VRPEGKGSTWLLGVSTALCVAAGCGAAPRTAPARAADTASRIPQQLPDDYLSFELLRRGEDLVGGAEHFDGFTITLEVSRQQARDLDSLLAAVGAGEVSGKLTYPDGRETPVHTELVQHRGVDEIYMKSSLGYFLWEYVEASPERVAFAFYWWYCPPAVAGDLEILGRARALLSSPERWRKRDDRKCDDDEASQVYSLFCALKLSSIAVAGEYNHHNTAMQTVRFVIEELSPGRELEHTLMDFNNDPDTGHGDILEVLDEAAARVTRALKTRG